MVIKYGFFNTPFLLPKHPPRILVSLEMAQQVSTIEKRFIFDSNLKTIYNFLVVVRDVTLIEVDCIEEI